MSSKYQDTRRQEEIKGRHQCQFVTWNIVIFLWCWLAQYTLSHGSATNITLVSETHGFSIQCGLFLQSAAPGSSFPFRFINCVPYYSVCVV